VQGGGWRVAGGGRWQDKSLGFGVWGLGFRIWGVGVWGLGFGVKGFRNRVSGFEV
jgi:hypothetical protein